MLAGIVIDRWKLETFRKHLDGAGFKYTEHKGSNAEFMILKVEIGDLEELNKTVRAAQGDCKK